MTRKNSLIDSLKDYFQKEAEQFQVDCAFLYGSRGRGLPRFDSDVDVAVLFADEPTEKELFERLTVLSLALSESIGLEVEMIPLYRDFRRPLLDYNAIVMGIPVYIKDFSDYINLINEAIFQLEDFELFGLEWQKSLARKTLEAIRHV
jgi:predicted nucleotidyltransferase